jgi:hypothetical protein
MNANLAAVTASNATATMKGKCGAVEAYSQRFMRVGLFVRAAANNEHLR